MATIQFKVTTPHSNNGKDLGAPSYADLTVSGSSDPRLPNGTYDAWCLNPPKFLSSKITYTAEVDDGMDVAAYRDLGIPTDPTLGQVMQINWIVAQAFTADAKFAGRYSFGEVQSAIWDILGFSGYETEMRDLTANGTQTLERADVEQIKSLAAAALTTGTSVLPSDILFSAVIDPVDDSQPVLIQWRGAKLGDYVWEDLDGDGLQDLEESGINNVTVNLYDAAGNLIRTTVTGDDVSTPQIEQGFYEFIALKPGEYQVEFIKPADYVGFTQAHVGADATSTHDSDAGDGGRTQVVTLASGEYNRSLDAGLVKRASLGDRVWLDADGDGQQQAGDEGVAGVKVILCDATGKPTGRSAYTDANGNYLFSDLTPGVYSVKFEAQPGYAFTAANLGGDERDSDADPATGQTGPYTLRSGESNLTADAGVIKLARIGDRIWEDKDADGQQEAGELGVRNVKVHLKDAKGAIIASTLTDANGLYAFDVLPGTYSIQIERPTDYKVTQQDRGDDALDSDIDATTLTSQSVTVRSGETNLTLDAGLYKAAKLGDRVWLDMDGDGQQDAGELGMAGVKVVLCDATGTPVGRFAYTNNDGAYLFTDLMPGTYSVKFEAPTGFAFTRKDQGGDSDDSDADMATGRTGSYTLNSGEANLTADAGLVRKARVGDRIWEDKDADGQQETGELGIRNVKVHLKDAKGAIVASTLTDANGHYAFDVLPGTYSIQIERPAGYSVTQKDLGNDTSDSDIDATTLTSQFVTVRSGDTNLTLDGGLYKPAQLGDRVWLDTDGDGQQDAGELGVAGVKVILCDAAGTLVGRFAYTDANGTYLFTDLMPGTYSVKFVAPTGYAFTRKDQGGDGGDSDADMVTGRTGNYTLNSGDSNLTVDAGLVRMARLGDRIWEDKDADGQQDAGEMGIGGVAIQLRDASGTVIASTVTDAAGNYGFDVLPGTFSIQIAKPAGYEVTRVNSGNDASDSDIDPYTLKSHAVTVLSGQSDLTLDGGLYKTACLGDRVWLDLDGDGQQEAGENGVAGVRVVLCDGQGNPTGHSTLTDANGNYLFNNLMPGIYSVKFEPPAGYLFTRKDQGLDSGDSDADISTGKTGYYTLGSGEINRTVDAGLVQKARIGDRVWEDKDFDGQQDDAELGIAGVKVHLKDALGTVVASTYTDLRGIYSFEVLPGTYSIQIDKPAGYQLTRKDAAADTVDSDIDPNTLTSAPVTVRSGESNLTLDAGLFKKTSEVGNFVWHDRNGNGRQDAGEEGIANVRVHLTDADGNVLRTATTGATGMYLFTELNAGVYRVQVETPTGYTFTQRNIGDDAGDSDVNRSTGLSGQFTLGEAEIDLTRDAGLFRQASIGDRVWIDRDHDNLQDATEPGLANVKVSLQDATGATIDTTYTDGLGYYRFVELDPGQYRIVFDKSDTRFAGVDMSTWIWAKKDAGSNDAIDADAHGGTDVAVTAYTTLSSGETDLTWDAGVTPIVIDLNGDGVRTLSRQQSGGGFDLLGNGKAIHSGWASAQDGMLAIDANGNGRIDSVHELFGGLKKGDGFAKLRAYDSDGNGVVDGRDAGFESLLIWRDADSDHATDTGELLSLTRAGVASVSVEFVEQPFLDAMGNLHLERSSATLSDGSMVDMTDVYFNVAGADAAQAGVPVTRMLDLLVEDRSLADLLPSSGEAKPPSNAATPTQHAASNSHFDSVHALLTQLEHQEFSAMP